MSIASDGFSSHGGSGAGSSLIQISKERNDMEPGAASSTWTGCFGTFYTINKDREISILFFVFKYTMEFLQLVLLMLGVQYGWQFKTETKAWQFVEFIQVRPFFTLIGHGLFVVFFVAFIVLLLICVAIYAWVFHCFQNNKFDYMWPLRLARLFGAWFFEALDVMSLSLLVTAIDCRYYGWGTAQRMINNEFPTLECLAMPSVVYFIMAVLALVMFIIMAAANKLAQMDLNPATRRLDAYAHPAIELWGFAIKTLMVLAAVFLGDYRHLAVFWLICTVMLAFFFWKWEPMVVSWVNYIRMGTYASVVYVACLFMALHFPPDPIKASPKLYVEYVDTLEVALVGIAPAFALGALISFFRLRYFRVTITNRFRTAASTARARGIYRFSSPRQVEIVARCCRVWVDYDTLSPDAIALAERVLKSGLACLTNSPFMIIWYTSFLVDVQGSFQSGFSQLQVSLKLDPSFIDKYAIFSREQDHTQKSASGQGDSPNDMFSDVEFQKNYRLAVRAHKEALQALRTFWQLLQHAAVRFEDLAEGTRHIDVAIRQADKTYRTVLQRHGEMPRLLRLYSKYLERVKHDPWSASRWSMEADKLELRDGVSRHTNMLGLDEDGGDIGQGRISLFSVGPDGQERSLCVFNAQGLMTMTNEAMRGMFGYGKAELKGKSVGLLMPPSFAEQQMQLIKGFVLSGHGAVVMRTSEVVLVHKDRHMFGARITIVRILGIGEDSIFLASLEAVPPEGDAATVWLLASGQILSVDSQFCDWFGHRSADMEGGSTAVLTPNSKQLDEVLQSARFAMVLATQAALLAAAQDSAEDDVMDPAAQLLAAHPSPEAANQMEAIAQALAAAAAPVPTPSAAASAATSEWHMRGARMLHKFADPFEVDIKITNTRPSSAFCMHILTVRRTGAAATKPMPHMLVTSPMGPVIHVTEAFAALLGTTPKGFIANGSTTAMEALMVQPFGLMHRAGLSGSLPLQLPPSYSCRSGLSVLMPVLGAPTPEAVPVKMLMKKRPLLEKVFHVCIMEPTTFEQALDERSLRLTVDDRGIVQSVGASPSTLFGFKAVFLVGHSVASCVTALRGTGSSDETAPSLAELSARTDVSPGSFWRVGVGLAQEDVDVVLKTSTISGTPLLKQAKMVPAVMTVSRVLDPTLDITLLREDSAGPRPSKVTDKLLTSAFSDAAAAEVRHLGYELRLWRADMVTSVVEVDSGGLVVEPEAFLDKLYPSGAALGMGAASMLGHHIRDFIPLADHKVVDLYDDLAFPAVPTKGTSPDTNKKRSNIKVVRNPDSSRVGPQALLMGRHRLDGLDLNLSVQIVRKGNAGAYLVIHLFNPQPGRLDLSDHMGPDRLYDADTAMARQSRHANEGDLISAAAQAVSKSRRESVAPVGDTRVSPPHGGGILSRPTGGTPDQQRSGPRSRRASVMRFAVGEEEPQASAALTEAAVAASNANAAACPASRIGSPGHRSMAASRSNSVRAGSVREWVMGDGSASVAARAAAELDDEEDGHGFGGGEALNGLAGHHPKADGSDGDVDDEGCPVAHRDSSNLDGDGGDGAEKGLLSGHSKRSVGGDSNNLDEANNANDEDADYRRGQRFKKLNRMLNSDSVTANRRRFRRDTIGITLILTVASIAVYVMCKLLLELQIQSVVDLDNMGLAARKMMRLATMTLDLGMMYQPYPNQFLTPALPGFSNAGADLAAMKSTFRSSITLFATYASGTYLGFGAARRLPEAFGLRAMWETPNLPEYHYVSLPSSELGMNPYNFLPADGGNGTITTGAIFKQISMFEGMNKMVAFFRDIVANADWYNKTVSTTGSHTRWLDWTSILYVRTNCVVTYLNAWMLTLDGYAQVVISAAVQLNYVQVFILVFEGCLLSVGAVIYMWYLCNKVDRTRYNIYSVFVVVPLAMVRNLATQRIILDDPDGSDDDMDDQPGAKAGAAAAAGTAAGLAVGVHGDAAKGGGTKAAPGAPGKVHINIAGDSPAAKGGAASQSLWARFLGVILFWRAKKVPGERRTLSRSPRGALWLTWPFAIWGILIIVINALGHRDLANISGPIMTFNTVNFFQCRVWRVLYEAQLVQFSNDTALSASTLKQYLADMELEYQAMLYGASAVPAGSNAHFSLITQGIANAGGEGQQILFSTTACLASPTTGCLPTTDVFYQYTVHGFDTLLRRMFDVVEQIVEILQKGVMITNDGPEVQFLWKTRQSMVGGADLLVTAYKNHVQAVYIKTLMMQTVAMVLTLCLVGLYLLLMLRPYLVEVSAETRRITELLTQLPIDIDVEGLVQRALVTSLLSKTAAVANKAAAAPGAAAAAGGGGGGAQNSGLPNEGSTTHLLSPVKPSAASAQRISILSQSTTGPGLGQGDSVRGMGGAGREGSINSMESPFLRAPGGRGGSSGKNFKM